jgi:hypothetical protein
MPFFFLKSKKSPPVMGAGYYGMLHIDERIEWPSPSGVPYAVIENRLTALKDEIHRVATQMARGVENNAAAIGRSGQSKQVDNTATEVVLKAYSERICEPIEQTARPDRAGTR